MSWFITSTESKYLDFILLDIFLDLLLILNSNHTFILILKYIYFSWYYAWIRYIMVNSGYNRQQIDYLIQIYESDILEYLIQMYE